MALHSEVGVAVEKFLIPPATLSEQRRQEGVASVTEVGSTSELQQLEDGIRGSSPSGSRLKAHRIGRDGH
jgi:hypothetical protein